MIGREAESPFFADYVNALLRVANAMFWRCTPILYFPLSLSLSFCAGRAGVPSAFT